MNKYTEITLVDRYGSVSVSTNKSDMTIDDVVEELVKPVLLAKGYSSELVKFVNFDTDTDERSYSEAGY